MNTKKLFFGFLSMAILITASCTTDGSSDDIYESGVERSKIRISNKESVERSKIRISNKESVERSKIRINNRKRN